MVVTSISKTNLGKYGPSVNATGFGLASFGGAYGAAPDYETRFKVLDRALELGNTFWDTSDAYGDCEEMLGKWFARTGQRDKIFLASKFGMKVDKVTFKGLGVDSSAEYCEKACNESLERMGIDHVDLYYAHRLNQKTPVEQTMRALKKLKEQGKIRYIGLSEISSNTLRRACKIVHVDAVQMEYSPFELAIESEAGTNLLATCRELGVAVVAYSPLGRGLWTGAFTTTESVSNNGDQRGARFPRFSEQNMATNMGILDQYKVFAAKKGCTVAQLSLAWLRKQGEGIITIPGTKRIPTLEENWQSLNVTLSDEEEAELRKFVATAAIAGERSVSESKAFAYVDTVEEA